MRGSPAFALSLAAITLLGACDRRREPPGVDLLAGWRPGSARLAGFAWAPPNTTSVDSPRSREIRQAAREIENRPGSTASVLRLRSLLRLATGDLDDAIRLLERARSIYPEDRAIRVDLISSLLERSRRGNRWRDALSTLELLAEDEQPDAETRFLRAQVLDRLGLRASARAAWRQVVDGADSVEWKGEALASLAALERPTRADLWRRALASPAARAHPADYGEIRDAAGRAPALAFDELFYGALATWGNLELAGNGAAANESLDLCRAAGSELLERGDRTLASAVEAIDRATGRKRRALARGHVHLAAGWVAFESLEVASALPDLERAEQELRQGESPARLWAQYWAGASLLYEGRFEALDSRFDSLAAELQTELDPRLAASLARTRGTAALRVSDFTSARALYAAARAGYERLGDRFNRAILDAYQADVDSLLGQVDSEWRRRLEATAELQETPTSPWLPSVLYGSALAALAAGSPAGALAFATENRLVLASMPRLHVDRAEAALLIARLHLRLDAPAAAAEAIEAARQAVQGIPDPALRRRLAADLELELSRVDLADDPSSTLRHAEQAAKLYRSVGIRSQVPELALLAARAHLARGDVDRARLELRRGFRELTRILDGLDDPSRAASYAELGGELVDTWASLEVEIRADPEQALDLIEAVRRPRQQRALGASQQALPAGALPGHVTLLSYALLPNRLLIAVVKDGDRKIATVSVSRSELESRCRKLFALLATAAPETEIRSESDWLSSRLLAPISSWLPPDSTLAVVADRALHLVPFAALPDPRDGRYLVERHPIVYASSETEATAWRDSGARRRETAPRVAIFAPSGGSAEGILLPALAAAVEEARSIARLYSGAQLLEGEAATAPAFLTALRGSDIVHFAGHAQSVPGDPGASRLWLGDGRHAGRLLPLLASELLFSRPTGSALVVLSGCETSLPASRRRLGDDGFAAPLLAGGARAVLGTSWAVGDVEAEALFVSFHRSLVGGLGAAEALRRAQVDRIRSPITTDRSPARWAFARMNATHP